MLLFIELNVFLLTTPEHEDGHDEENKTDERNNEAHNLPESVVGAVATLGGLIYIQVGCEVPHHELPERPWDEILDREAPPEDEDGVPPGCRPST